MRALRLAGSTLGACFVLAATAFALETRAVAIVTQVQGAVFYRTSITLSNGNPSITTPVVMFFSYRSPVDGTFQVATLNLSPALGPHRVRFLDDMVQAFKNAGAIRAQDASANLFGTLLVDFEALDIRAETAAVARTYSPAPGGGTLGIAYPGRCFCETGSLSRVLGSARGGVFGNDGSTRANLGIVNEGFGPTDVRVTYYDGETGVQLKQFLLSTAAGHDLEENEVFQLNNIFNDSAIPSTVHTLVVQVEAVIADVFVSAYVVQLDNTTNDGSFFFLEEE
ncbi:MAG: hypothetical protein WEB59_05905 [Thermoanaerobaculia bacterium]